MIIDAYAHCGVSKYFPVEKVRAVMSTAGVDRAVLCQHLGEYDNRYLESVIRKYLEQFRAVCLVDPAEPDAGRKLQLWRNTGCFSGLRLPVETLADNFPLCAQAAELGFVLLVYAAAGIASAISPIRRLIAECPDVKIVISHLGNPKVEDGKMIRGWELLDLSELPNVFVLLSGLSMFCEFPHAPLAEFVAQVIARFGADRIMWGSNYPVCGDVTEYRRDMNALLQGAWGLDGRQLAFIMEATAQRLWFEEPMKIVPARVQNAGA
jgi:predicted TIM-barrel fold metal-dependent hydrolase